MRIQHTPNEVIAATIGFTCSSLGYHSVRDTITWAFKGGWLPFLAEAACAKRSKITFSTMGWDAADKKQKYELIVHEVCHVVAYNEDPTEPHSESHSGIWKKLMARMGFDDASATLDIDPSRSTSADLFLTCGCGKRRASYAQIELAYRSVASCNQCYQRVTSRSSAVSG